MNTSDFENHVVFEKISKYYDIIKEENTVEKVDLERLSFFKTALDFINQRIKIAIPDLIPQAGLDALSNEINASMSQFNQFLGNNNSGHLNNASTNIEAAITRIKNFPIGLSKSDFNFSRKVAGFESTVKKKYDSLKKERVDFEKEIQSFKQDLENKEKEIDRLIKLIEGKESEIQNLNSTFQTQFNNIKSEHDQSFQNDKKEYKRQIEQIKDGFNAELTAIQESIEDNTSKIIDDLNTKLEDAKKIVNVIGNVGVTGNYQIIANEHKISANFWRWVAIGFMAIFSALLVWTLIELSTDQFDWVKSVIRLVAAAALSYPATYAARESNKHRKLETLNRTAELELASVDTFIEMLDTTKKQEIKARLVDKYFGNDRSQILNEEKEYEGLSIKGYESILNSISKVIGK